jgi:arabinogalactan oligomer / maltooligosaccharide transport system permease protein
MTATVAGSGTPNGRGRVPRPLPFTAGLFLKIFLLALLNAVAVWALSRCVDLKAWGLVAVIVITTLLLDVVFLTTRFIPGKYIVPGSIFLVLFYLVPVAYTVQTSFTNYGGNTLLPKSQAITRIVESSREPISGAYTLEVLRGADRKLIYVLTDLDGNRFLGEPNGLKPIDESKATIDEDQNLLEYNGAVKLKLRELADNQTEIGALRINDKSGEIRAESLTAASALRQRFTYDSKRDRIIDTVDNIEYSPKDGQYTAPADAAVDETRRKLEPGFKSNIGLRNYTAVLSDPNVRGPFLRVFVWNVAFAGGTVLLTVTLGLLLAMALNHPKLKGTKLLRQLLFVPYALPSFMMILVWSQGLLNPKYGFINNFFGVDISWLDNPWLARLSILLINTWLGFPYMFLLCTGLLQSIPTEFREAASIDGATGWQTFRRVILPNLLIGLAPMLISGFAFNFNNFGPVYLTTRGGPPIPGARTDAGQTDILVTWTQKLAFGSGKGSQYGFASSISVLIFFIVGFISFVSFRNTKAFKETK